MFYPNFENDYVNFFKDLNRQTDWHNIPFAVHVVAGKNGHYDQWLDAVNNEEKSSKGFINNMWVSGDGVMKISPSRKVMFIATPESLAEDQLLDPLYTKMMYNIDVYYKTWAGMLNDIKPWTYYEPDLS